MLMATKRIQSARNAYQWSEADYAKKGVGSIKLRLPIPVLSQLVDLAQHANVTRQEMMESLIKLEHQRVFPEAGKPKKDTGR